MRALAEERVPVVRNELPPVISGSLQVASEAVAPEARYERARWLHLPGQLLKQLTEFAGSAKWLAPR